MFLTGPDDRLTYLNPAAEKLFGLLATEAVGRPRRVLHAPDGMPSSRPQTTKRRASTYRTTFQRTDGTVFLGDTTSSDIIGRGEVPGTLTIVRVASVVEQAVDVLQRLHAITNDAHRSFEQRMDGILQLGADHFSLPLAIQSRVSGQEYVVEHCRDPAGNLIVGTEFDLPGTYCTHTLRANRPTGFHHVARSQIRAHPCYRDFKLEAYLGCPITVHGKPYGTLNFSRLEACQPFTRDDKALVQLFADWAGHAITQELGRQELERQASTDGLTGLLNRRAALEGLTWQLAHARRSSLPLAVVAMDLDHFKDVNDQWGHDAGDVVLRHFADTCNRVKREVDLCSRFGGEEFMVVLPDTNLLGARRFGERLLAALREHQTVLPSGDRVTVSASLGIALARPGESVKGLLRRADDAMYAAKDAGRAQIRLAG